MNKRSPRERTNHTRMGVMRKGIEDRFPSPEFTGGTEGGHLVLLGIVTCVCVRTHVRLRNVVSELEARGTRDLPFDLPRQKSANCGKSRSDSRDRRSLACQSSRSTHVGPPLLPVCKRYCWQGTKWSNVQLMGLTSDALWEAELSHLPWMEGHLSESLTGANFARAPYNLATISSSYGFKSFLRSSTTIIGMNR